MKATLVVHTNSDDALLHWTVDALDEHTTGFAVQRKLRRGGRAGAPEWLDNYSPPGPAAHQLGEHQPSEVWPFRCFSWTDHWVEPGDRVSYRVVPVLASAPALREEMASGWSTPVTVGSKGAGRYSAHFNRGFVISQFVSRYLDEHYPGLTRAKALAQFKRDIGDDLEDRVRRFLSGHLRTAMIRLLEDVQGGGGEVYAALFELGDKELVAALEALGPRAHVVLANGSVEVRRDETTDAALETAAQARRRDENAAARSRLGDAGVDVQQRNRFISPGALAHNKFLVATTAAGDAKRVWTGSTNWTTTGLCTQLNNGLLVDDPAVAELYLRHWHALRDAGSEHPRALSESNSTPATVGPPRAGRVRASVHFTRARRRVDLAALGAIVREAKEGVLFLMFIPGASGTLADVRALAAAKPALLVRGVVSQLPLGRQDELSGATTTVRVTIVGAAPTLARPRTYDVVQPGAMEHPAAGWAVETTRNQFLGSIGHAIIHSKVLVIDPFSDDPIVVTGSHNFSLAASEKNDENFVVVRGERRLAEAYAVNIDSAWRHYAGRAGNPHPRLRGIEYLRALWEDQRREERFWRLRA